MHPFLRPLYSIICGPYALSFISLIRLFPVASLAHLHIYIYILIITLSLQPYLCFWLHSQYPFLINILSLNTPFILSSSVHSQCHFQSLNVNVPLSIPFAHSVPHLQCQCPTLIVPFTHLCSTHIVSVPFLVFLSLTLCQYSVQCPNINAIHTLNVNVNFTHSHC